MNEFSFIQFSDTINDCDIPLPIKLMSDVAFYTDKDTYSIWAYNNARTSSINIGADIVSLGGGLKYIKLIGEIPYSNECFTINLINEAGTLINISNPLLFISCEVCQFNTIDFCFSILCSKLETIFSFCFFVKAIIIN